MRENLTTADRVVLLLALIPYLIERGPTPLDELAHTFQVDRRVLRTLIPFLGTAGVPGETRTYQDEDLFDIDWEAFEEHEIVSLTKVIAVDDTPRFSATESAALVAGLHALRPMLPESELQVADGIAAKLAAVEPAVSAHALVSVSSDPEPASLAVIAGAIDAGNQLGFDYRDVRGAETQRRVEPLVLAQSSGTWYLRAYCLDRDDERTFAVDRMRRTRPLTSHATRRAGGRAALPVLQPSTPGVTARVAIRERALSSIAGFVPRVQGAGAPGWLLAEVDLALPEVAVRLVQAAPGDLVVEEPAEAREAVRLWAERALAQYDA